MREAVIPNMTGTQETLVELVNEQVTRAEKSEPKSGSLFTIPACLSMGPSPSSSMPTFGCLKSPPSPISGTEDRLHTALLPHLVTADKPAWCGVREVRLAQCKPDYPSRKTNWRFWSHHHQALTTSRVS